MNEGLRVETNGQEVRVEERKSVPGETRKIVSL